MCTRFQLLEHHYRELLERLGLDGAAGAEFLSRYNIAPGSALPVVRQQPAPAARATARLRWGLVPSWVKSDEAGNRLTNARAETLATKPSFRDAFRTRRCLIPASGFYEWETVGRTKKPWLFRRRDEQPFALAGLWESWRAADGSLLETCAVITTAPNELMRPIHHRMPVMLSPEQFEPWLDPRTTAPEQLTPLLRPPESAAMSAVALSPYVSNVRHEGPACLTPAGAADKTNEPQLSLGL
jgi:putative SOS response-associated peptidase YedK